MLARCQNLNSTERRKLWLWIKGELCPKNLCFEHENIFYLHVLTSIFTCFHWNWNTLFFSTFIGNTEQQATEFLRNEAEKTNSGGGGGGGGGGGSSGKKKKIRKDPTEGMSKRQKNIWIKERNRLRCEQEERRIGLTLAFREGLPEDSFREMMGFLYK